MSVLEYRSAPAAEPDAEQTSGHWLGWAVYLAMSWTWCIGMYLPVLLLRDYGPYGVLAFGLPNVLGAAAMGWMISAVRSVSLVMAHRRACVAFSLVTVAFHAFFGLWIIVPLVGGVPALLAAAATIGVGALDSRFRSSGWALAAATLGVSVTLFVVGVLARELPFVRSGVPAVGFRDLQWLTPVMMFGFALCPYLDLTFHRARAHTSARDARLAFSVGFSTFFVVMLLFTVAYSGWMLKFSPRAEGAVPQFVGLVIGVHLLVQAALTTGFHAREATTRDPAAIVLLVAILVLLGVSVAYPHLIFGSARVDQRDFYGERVYRLFMGFYGLVFPAYVWLCMIPSPRARPSRRALIVFAVAVLVAAPMFWMGFILGQMIWLLPGLGVVLLARLAVRGNHSG